MLRKLPAKQVTWKTFRNFGYANGFVREIRVAVLCCKRNKLETAVVETKQTIYFVFIVLYMYFMCSTHHLHCRAILFENYFYLKNKTFDFLFLKNTIDKVNISYIVLIKKNSITKIYTIFKTLVEQASSASNRLSSEESPSEKREATQRAKLAVFVGSNMATWLRSPLGTTQVVFC